MDSVGFTVGSHDIPILVGCEARRNAGILPATRHRDGGVTKYGPVTPASCAGLAQGPPGRRRYDLTAPAKMNTNSHYEG